MNSPHYFIGLQLPEKVKGYLKGVQQELELENYFRKVTYIEDFHITLLFLGDWGKDGQRDQLWNWLEKNLREINQFSLSLSETGFFGNGKQPRVVWAGTEDEEELHNLQEVVAVTAQNTGYELEKRPYRPHITLAKSYNSKIDFPVAQHRKLENLQWTVSEAVLFQVLPGHKPMYKPVSKISFSG